MEDPVNQLLVNMDERIKLLGEVVENLAKMIDNLQKQITVVDGRLTAVINNHVSDYHSHEV